MKDILAMRWIRWTKRGPFRPPLAHLLCFLLLLPVFRPASASGQQPPLEAALAVAPEEPREQLARPDLDPVDALPFGLHMGAALILGPLVELGVEKGLLGGGAGSVGGLKIAPGSIGSGSGVGLSVGYVFYSEPYWGGVSGGMTVRGYMEHSAFLGVRDVRGANYVRATGAYDLDTQDDFSGLGMRETSPEEKETDYRQEEWRVLGDGQVSVLEKFRVGARGGFRKNMILRGKDDELEDTQEVFSDSALAGVGILPGLLEKEADYGQVGGVLAFDTRNDARNPDRGVLIAGSFDAFRGISDTPFEWDRIAGEFAGYLPVPDETRVIALRLFAVNQRPRKGQVLVPFYYLSSLGGSNLLRSFSSFRFQDNDLVYGSVEFRRRVWAQREGEAALDGSLFVESGGVYRDLSDPELSDMEQSFGSELRLLVPNDVIARMGVALGSIEGFKFYVGGGGRF